MKNLLPGNTVLFGKYHIRDGESLDPIEWIVLESDDESVLLLSKYVIEAMNFNEKYEETTWERCSLRRWLNWTFFDTAFTEEERTEILQVRNENRDPHPLTLPVLTQDPRCENALRRTDVPCRLESLDTLDKVFLLSPDEAEHFKDTFVQFPPEATPYALQKNLVSFSGNNCCYRWWLRIRGEEGDLASCVYQEDSISRSGFPVFFSAETNEGVRPVIRIKRTAANFEE